MALAQAALVAQALREHNIEVRIVELETAGDRRAPDTAWGEGAFVSAIERALIEGEVDIAVHSAKDLPTDGDPRLTIAAFLPREEPRDALVLPLGRPGSMESLQAGCSVGTDSPRRTGFLRAHRDDLDVRPLHGNVDTRLRRLDSGEVDSLVLAAAGLIRLGRADRIAQLLPTSIVPPAPGQGAIAVQVRVDDLDTCAVVIAIDDGETRLAVEAERAFLHATGGGCRAPIGALATIKNGSIQLVGGFATIDGRIARLETVTGRIEDKDRLAHQLAGLVVRARSNLPGAPRVLLTRPLESSARLAARLADRGIAAVVVPSIDIELDADSPPMRSCIDDLRSFSWAVATSANAVRSVAIASARANVPMSDVRWAAVGLATAHELGRLGVSDIFVPSQSTAAALATEIPVKEHDRVAWFRGDLADDEFSRTLESRGAEVTNVPAYRTVKAPDSSRPLLGDALAAGPIAAVVLASPSAARGLVELASKTQLSRLTANTTCIGERTATAARDAGFEVTGIAPSPDADTVADLVARSLSERPAQTSGATL